MKSKHKYVFAVAILAITTVLVALMMQEARRPSITGKKAVQSENPVSEVVANSVSAVANGNFQKLYRVKTGDTLSAIAQKHNISVRDILTANQDKDGMLAVDEWLVIPKANPPRNTGVLIRINRPTNAPLSHPFFENYNRAERHNLDEMQKYQQRVLDQTEALKAARPKLPDELRQHER